MTLNRFTDNERKTLKPLIDIKLQIIFIYRYLARSKTQGV